MRCPRVIAYFCTVDNQPIRSVESGNSGCTPPSGYLGSKKRASPPIKEHATWDIDALKEATKDG